MNLQDKQDFSEKDVLEILANNVEESIHLDFKSAAALSKQDNKRKEISKDVSAFANSDGGVIIYGIKEENHIASSLDFVDGNVYTKEWLEQTINANIQQSILNLRIFPVRFNGDIAKTIYIVQIPRSDRSPHMSKDQRYYRRFNFESVAMEEYEIRNHYLKVIDGKIEWDSILIRPDIKEDNEEDDNDIYEFNIEFQFSNDSNYVAEKYKIACTFNNPKPFNFSYERHKEYDITRRTREGFIISTTKTIPIFPGEVLNGLSFTVKIKKNSFEETLEALKITLFVFNQNNVSEHDATKDFIDLIKNVKESYYDNR